MKKVIVGITSGYEREEDLVNYNRNTLCIDYSKSVIAAGGNPIILPVTDVEEIVDAQVEMMDALILSGGNDIHPFYYGEGYKEGMGEVARERDAYEFCLLEKFLKTGKPILGICRGMQLINVYFGGTLYQDLRYYPTWHLEHCQKLFPDLEVQIAYMEKGKHLFRKIFGDKVGINSFHHQAIAKLGDGLEVLAKTEDGIVEAIQLREHSFLYAVQWHPEMMTARGNKEMQEIFEALIKAV